MTTKMPSTSFHYFNFQMTTNIIIIITTILINIVMMILMTIISIKLCFQFSGLLSTNCCFRFQHFDMN